MTQKIITNYSGDLIINHNVHKNLRNKIKNQIEQKNFKNFFYIKKAIIQNGITFDILVYQTRSLYVLVRLDHWKSGDLPDILWEYVISDKDSKYNAVKDILKHIKLMEQTKGGIYNGTNI